MPKKQISQNKNDVRIGFVVIDDNLNAIKAIETEAAKMPGLALEHSFTDPIAGLMYLKRHVVDLLFLDVQMDKLNGLDLLRQLDVKPKAIILCTSFADFAAAGFELEVTDFLIKPFVFERFAKAVKRAEARIHNYPISAQSIRNDYTFVNMDKTLKRIDLAKINFIAAEQSGIKISLSESGFPLLWVNESLESFMKRAGDDRFFQTHRSFVVAIDRVDKVEKGFVSLTLPPEQKISITAESVQHLKKRMGLTDKD